MNLEGFERGLREVLGPDPGQRPFVCDGSPLECQVFVVGLNPTTGDDFWPFWDPRIGFDREAWRRAYLQNRGGAPSPTRRKIELFARSMLPLRCLETNAVSKASRRFRALGHQPGTTEVFEFLLDAVRPRAMLVHGTYAVKHIKRTYGGTLNKTIPCSVAVSWGSITALGGAHFSRFWSAAEIESAAACLRRAFEETKGV